jgi:hypothetical protein
MKIKAFVMLCGQLLYAFIKKVFHQAFHTVLYNAFCRLVTPETLASQKFHEVEKQIVFYRYMVYLHLF